MNKGGSTDGFALDVQGLDRLRNSAHLDPQSGLKQASKQFEALFLQMMLKSMRAAVPRVISTLPPPMSTTTDACAPTPDA